LYGAFLNKAIKMVVKNLNADFNVEMKTEAEKSS
jgi:hypothetical protein